MRTAQMDYDDGEVEIVGFRTAEEEYSRELAQAREMLRLVQLPRSYAVVGRDAESVIHSAIENRQLVSAYEWREGVVGDDFDVIRKATRASNRVMWQKPGMTEAEKEMHLYKSELDYIQAHLGWLDRIVGVPVIRAKGKRCDMLLDRVADTLTKWVIHPGDAKHFRADVLGKQGVIFESIDVELERIPVVVHWIARGLMFIRTLDGWSLPARYNAVYQAKWDSIREAVPDSISDEYDPRYEIEEDEEIADVLERIRAANVANQQLHAERRVREDEELRRAREEAARARAEQQARRRGLSEADRVAMAERRRTGQETDPKAQSNMNLIVAIHGSVIRSLVAKYGLDRAEFKSEQNRSSKHAYVAAYGEFKEWFAFHSITLASFANRVVTDKRFLVWDGEPGSPVAEARFEYEEAKFREGAGSRFGPGMIYEYLYIPVELLPKHTHGVGIYVTWCIQHARTSGRDAYLSPEEKAECIRKWNVHNTIDKTDAEGELLRPLTLDEFDMHVRKYRQMEIISSLLDDLLEINAPGRHALDVSKITDHRLKELYRSVLKKMEQFTVEDALGVLRDPKAFRNELQKIITLPYNRKVPLIKFPQPPEEKAEEKDVARLAKRARVVDEFIADSDDDSDSSYSGEESHEDDSEDDDDDSHGSVIEEAEEHTVYQDIANVGSSDEEEEEEEEEPEINLLRKGGSKKKTDKAKRSTEAMQKKNAKISKRNREAIRAACKRACIKWVLMEMESILQFNRKQLLFQEVNAQPFLGSWEGVDEQLNMEIEIGTRRLYSQFSENTRSAFKSDMRKLSEMLHGKESGTLSLIDYNRFANSSGLYNKLMLLEAHMKRQGAVAPYARTVFFGSASEEDILNTIDLDWMTVGGNEQVAGDTFVDGRFLPKGVKDKRVKVAARKIEEGHGGIVEWWDEWNTLQNLIFSAETHDKLDYLSRTDTSVLTYDYLSRILFADQVSTDVLAAVAHFIRYNMDAKKWVPPVAMQPRFNLLYNIAIYLAQNGPAVSKSRRAMYAAQELFVVLLLEDTGSINGRFSIPVREDVGGVDTLEGRVRDKYVAQLVLSLPYPVNIAGDPSKTGTVIAHRSFLNATLCAMYMTGGLDVSYGPVGSRGMCVNETVTANVANIPDSTRRISRCFYVLDNPDRVSAFPEVGPGETDTDLVHWVNMMDDGVGFDFNLNDPDSAWTLYVLSVWSKPGAVLKHVYEARDSALGYRSRVTSRGRDGTIRANYRYFECIVDRIIRTFFPEVTASSSRAQRTSLLERALGDGTWQRIEGCALDMLDSMYNTGMFRDSTVCARVARAILKLGKRVHSGYTKVRTVSGTKSYYDPGYTIVHLLFRMTVYLETSMIEEHYVKKKTGLNNGRIFGNWDVIHDSNDELPHIVRYALYKICEHIMYILDIQKERKRLEVVPVIDVHRAVKREKTDEDVLMGLGGYSEEDMARFQKYKQNVEAEIMKARKQLTGTVDARFVNPLLSEREHAIAVMHASHPLLVLEEMGRDILMSQYADAEQVLTMLTLEREMSWRFYHIISTYKTYLNNMLRFAMDGDSYAESIIGPIEAYTYAKNEIVDKLTTLWAKYLKRRRQVLEECSILSTHSSSMLEELTNWLKRELKEMRYTLRNGESREFFHGNTLDELIASYNASDKVKVRILRKWTKKETDRAYSEKENSPCVDIDWVVAYFPASKSAVPKDSSLDDDVLNMFGMSGVSERQANPSASGARPETAALPSTMTSTWSASNTPTAMDIDEMFAGAGKVFSDSKRVKMDDTGTVDAVSEFVTKRRVPEPESTEHRDLIARLKSDPDSIRTAASGKHTAWFTCAQLYTDKVAPAHNQGGAMDDKGMRYLRQLNELVEAMFMAGVGGTGGPFVSVGNDTFLSLILREKLRRGSGIGFNDRFTDDITSFKNRLMTNLLREYNRRLESRSGSARDDFVATMKNAIENTATGYHVAVYLFRECTAVETIVAYHSTFSLQYTTPLHLSRGGALGQDSTDPLSYLWLHPNVDVANSILTHFLGNARTRENTLKNYLCRGLAAFFNTETLVDFMKDSRRWSVLKDHVKYVFKHAPVAVNADDFLFRTDAALFNDATELAELLRNDDAIVL